MKAKLKKDYLNYLFFRTKKNLTRYQISAEDSDLIKNIFGKIINSEYPHASLFILYNIKEFKNLGKYMIFILKKLEDDVINFENLLYNLDNDSEFIQNEILSYLSNPERKIINEIKFEPEVIDDESRYVSKQTGGTENKNTKNTDGDELKDKDNNESEEDIDTVKPEESEPEETEFRKNYLELIQTEEDETGVVYELPGIESKDPYSDPYSLEFNSPELDLPDEQYSENDSDLNNEINDSPEIDKGEDTVIKNTDQELISEERSEEENVSGYISEEELYIDQEKEITGNIQETEDTDESEITGESPKSAESIEKTDLNESEEEDKIQLSDDIQNEIDKFEKHGEPDEDQEEEDSEESDEKLLEEINETEPEPANTLFVEYEIEIRDRNRFLGREFDSMIKILAEKSKDEEERAKIIFSIIETSKHLEELSRKMSLEVISNIYQTILLSFEKISDSKYDITESTLNLFKKGLTLIISLINGDNYFGYKDILKSIENIRNTLIEEKQKRETYLKRLQEKMLMDKNLDQRFPDETAKSNVALLKKYIKDTENNFKSLEKISGEYQIYEALRSLSGSLNNFKDIVKVSKELKMKKLVQLSEAGYIFVKFLQNYRINPVTDETKEIFGYIVHNLKLLTMGRDSGDVDLFISYLNDPVKIFANTDKKNK